MYSRSKIIRSQIILICMVSGIILISNSCDYKRSQTIPKDIQVLSKKTICDFNSYRVFEYTLQQLEGTSISNWQDGLVCKGYSNRPMSLPWTRYDDLSIEDKGTIEYFIENIDIYSNLDFVKLGSYDKHEFWVAACRTEWINEVSGEINENYHVLYFLNKSQSRLYEIRNLD